MNYKRIFFKFFSIVFIFIGFHKISFSQDIYTLYNKDTVFIDKNSVIYNLRLDYKSYEDFEFVNSDHYLFTGYLVIIIDSNSYYQRMEYAKDKFYLNVSTFWVSGFDQLDIDSIRHYYFYHPSLIDDGEFNYYFQNKRDDLSIFLHYLYYHNQFNYTRKLDCVDYLYMGYNRLLGESLISPTIFKRDSDNKRYIFFETQFRCAIAKFKSTGVEFLIPTSQLYSFKSLEENAGVYLERGVGKIKDFGFTKDEKIVRIIK